MNLPIKTTATRGDGMEARQRLLHAALRLFAEKGFSKTSTREIAQAGAVNIAAISYYFGDKAGLYRAVFDDPLGRPEQDLTGFANPNLSLREALSGLLVGFTEPLKQGDLVQHCMRLHFREMLEPTGVWDQHIASSIKPTHEALLQVLGRHLQLEAPDDDLHRLAFSIVGLGIHLFVGHDITRAIRPALADSPQAIDCYAERLVEYALAMVQAEAQRRLTQPQPTRRGSIRS
ncbi:CerR family C-terminal domain-containing protein [Rhodoferax sp.]|uniref:CerR family C-terminal domain-containing protein n=1 Tax=Rhodoferax sp. TaxID=50421 RepID=UPI00276FD3E9|nr:CerR family C-terminal domain-containing protein [Rhodoferax sp.]